MNIAEASGSELLNTARIMKICFHPSRDIPLGVLLEHTEVQSFLFLHEHPNAFQSWKKIPCNRRGDQCEDATPQKGKRKAAIVTTQVNEVGTGDAKSVVESGMICAGQALFP